MKYKGITLVESIIYLSLFGLVFVAIIQFFVSTIYANKNTRSLQRIENTAIFLNDHFLEEFQDATNVTIISYSHFEIDVDGVSYDYSIVNDRLIANDGADTAVTPFFIQIDNPNFSAIRDMSGNTIGLQMTFDLVDRYDSKITRSFDSIFILGSI